MAAGARPTARWQQQQLPPSRRSGSCSRRSGSGSCSRWHCSLPAAASPRHIARSRGIAWDPAYVPHLPPSGAPLRPAARVAGGPRDVVLGGRGQELLVVGSDPMGASFLPEKKNSKQVSLARLPLDLLPAVAQFPCLLDEGGLLVGSPWKVLVEGKPRREQRGPGSAPAAQAARDYPRAAPSEAFLRRGPSKVGYKPSFIEKARKLYNSGKKIVWLLPDNGKRAMWSKLPASTRSAGGGCTVA